MLRGLRTSRIRRFPLQQPPYPSSPTLSSLPFSIVRRAERRRGIGIPPNFRPIISIRATLARSRANVIPFILHNREYSCSISHSLAPLFLRMLSSFFLLSFFLLHICTYLFASVEQPLLIQQKPTISASAGKPRNQILS